MQLNDCPNEEVDGWSKYGSKPRDRHLKRKQIVFA